MKPVRVLHMIGSLNIGGSQTFVINLLNSIDRNKVQFDFVIDRPSDLHYASMVESLGAKIYVFPTFTGTNLLAIRRKWDDFFSDHQEYKILHSHIRSYASIFLPIAKRHGVKTIIHSHSTSNGNGLSSLVKRVLQYPLRYTADYLFACSKESGEWLFGKKASQRKNFFVIKNVIELEKYTLDTQIREQYRKEMLLEGKNVFVHVGRLHPAKNHKFLLDVFSKISNSDSNAVLLLVGGGELENEIKKQIDELGINEKVKMLGSRGDVNNILMASDCFLFPSLWEGVPLTVVEAQAAGLPCLVSDKVTEDVCISELVKRIPIDKGTTPWEKEIASIEFTRKDVSDKIRNAGYDAKTLAIWLEDFYEKVSKING